MPMKYCAFLAGLTLSVTACAGEGAAVEEPTPQMSEERLGESASVHATLTPTSCLTPESLTELETFDLGGGQSVTLPKNTVTAHSGKTESLDITFNLPLGETDNHGCLNTVPARIHPNDISSEWKGKERLPGQRINTPIYGFQTHSWQDIEAAFSDEGDSVQYGDYRLIEMTAQDFEGLDSHTDRSWPGQGEAVLGFIRTNYRPEADYHPSPYLFNYATLGVFRGDDLIALSETAPNDFGPGIYLPVGSTHTLSVSADMDTTDARKFLDANVPGSRGQATLPERRPAGWVEKITFAPPLESVMKAASLMSPQISETPQGALLPDMKQRGSSNTLFNYSGSSDSDPFMMRYAPAHRFSSVSDADIISVFSSSPNAEARQSGKTLILRRQSELDSCIPFQTAWKDQIGKDIGSPEFIEYPGAFVERWKTMRFGTNVFFGPIIGIVTNSDKTRILYFVEQSHVYWSKQNALLAVSTAERNQEIVLHLIDLDEAAYTAFKSSVEDTPAPEPKQYCQFVPQLDAEMSLKLILQLEE